MSLRGSGVNEFALAPKTSRSPLWLSCMTPCCFRRIGVTLSKSPACTLRTGSTVEEGGVSAFTAVRLPSSPNIDALPQFGSSVFAHLLAAVAFAAGQHPDVLHVEAQLAGDVGQNQVHGNVDALVPHVVIDHHQRSVRLQDTSALGNHQGHFPEVVPDHSGDSGIVDGSVGSGNGPSTQASVAATPAVQRHESPGRRCSSENASPEVFLPFVFDRTADHRLAKVLEGGFIDAEHRQFQGIGSGVVVPIAVRGRRDNRGECSTAEPR